MGYHVTDYHAALDKLTDTPLELTERDFDVLRDFNPADEQRGRAAVRQAQLALLPSAPLVTKAVASAPTTRLSPAMAKEMARAFDAHTTARLADRDKQWAARLAESEKRWETRFAQFRDETKAETKALATLVTRDAVPLPAPSLADLATTSSAKH